MGKTNTVHGDGQWDAEKDEDGVGRKEHQHQPNDDMRIVLSHHEDFRTEKTIVEHYLENRGHIVLFIRKFLNLIERVWGQARIYTHRHTNFTLARLRQIVVPTLDSVSTDLIREYFRRVYEYERAYLEGK